MVELIARDAEPDWLLRREMPCTVSVASLMVLRIFFGIATKMTGRTTTRTIIMRIINSNHHHLFKNPRHPLLLAGVLVSEVTTPPLLISFSSLFSVIDDIL
jgi:hypothetical protein